MRRSVLLLLLWLFLLLLSLLLLLLLLLLFEPACWRERKGGGGEQTVCCKEPRSLRKYDWWSHLPATADQMVHFETLFEEEKLLPYHTCICLFRFCKL